MTTTTDDPRQVLAELEARVLAGDTTVTAATLAKAKAAAEFADLAAEGAERRAATDAAEAQRLAEDELRAEIADAAAGLSSLQSAYDRLVTALRSFADETGGWDRRRAVLAARAKALGIAEEAEVLVDLSRRDWVEIAADEAAGRYGSSIKPITVGGLRASRWATHELHSAKARQRIEAEQVAELERKAAVHREREAQRVADQEADRAWVQARQREADAKTAERLARATSASRREGERW